MKKTTIHILRIIILMLLNLQMIDTAWAQVPQLFNYQGIARDAQGNPLSNQKMSIKLTVLPTSDAEVAEYEETQIVTTNEFGLYALKIGNGTPIKGNMKTVSWETGNKYIKVSIDPQGGAQYTDAGTNQLLSVPYAIYADKAGTTTKSDHDKTRSGTVSTSPSGTGTLNFLTKFTAANTIYNSQIFDNGTNIGIGTTSPVSKLHLQTTSGNVEHIRMQNTNSGGFGKFLMHNDIPTNYATFTKYGSAYAGGYPGIIGQYPYANMLAFGNNLGPFMLANNGNVGIGIVTGGNTVLKFNAQQNSGYIGIGGSAIPTAHVHFNNSATGDTILITNATTGHTKNDGLKIMNTGTAATIINQEASTLGIGTNNSIVMNLTATGNAEFAGQIKIAGGSPGAGKVLTSDANGLATWNVAAGGGNISGTGTPNFVSRFITSNTIGNGLLYDDGLNVGIGNSAPHAPLQFANVVGNRKAVLYEIGNNDHQFFGLGINSGLMRYQVADVVNNHVFYAGVTTNTSNELMRIQGNGNVGIGTATPGAKLEIAGQIKITGGTPGAGKVLTSDANGLATWSLPVAAGITGSGTPNYSPRFITATSIGNGAIYDNGTDVGIGTATPHAPLQFSNTQENRKIVLAENADNDHSFYGFGINAGIIRYQVGAVGGNHVFYSAINGFSSKELMRIQGNGNVGIGTDTANAALQFGNVASNRRIVMYENANNDHEFYGFGINSAIVRYQVGNTSSSHVFYAGNGNASSNELMRILGNGNVGIGAAVPTAKLTVNGTADKPGGGSWSVYSDRRLKDNITSYQDGLSTLLKIAPVKFHYNEKAGCDTKPEYVGVIAQELKEVAPYMVGTFQKDNQEYYNVDNSAMTYMLINAVKELHATNEKQQTIIEKQQKINEDLMQRLEKLEK